MQPTALTSTSTGAAPLRRRARRSGAADHRPAAAVEPGAARRPRTAPAGAGCSRCATGRGRRPRGRRHGLARRYLGRGRPVPAPPRSARAGCSGWRCARTPGAPGCTRRDRGRRGLASNQVGRMPFTGSPPSSLALGAPEPPPTGIPRRPGTMAAARVRTRRHALRYDRRRRDTAVAGPVQPRRQDPAPHAEGWAGRVTLWRVVVAWSSATAKARAWWRRSACSPSEFGQQTFDQVNLIQPGQRTEAVVKGAGGDGG